MYVQVCDNYGSCGDDYLGWSFGGPPLYLSYYFEDVTCTYAYQCRWVHYYAPSGGYGGYRSYNEYNGGVYITGSYNYGSRWGTDVGGYIGFNGS